ncbi:hypothetical protein AB0B89_28275, partial [Sphaerisporangium sp. NPDC049002]|uniref:hypothetical protein n=1 Tax=Sphaerisporangium sp. NPDC049002 TaxID=3155392 RepID=UPI0033CFBF28
MSVPRRAGGAALGILSLWLVLTLANWLTGRFWWWGGAVPLVLFFAARMRILGPLVSPRISAVTSNLPSVAASVVTSPS